MGAFYITTDLYFWIIDRGDLSDDSRNKVEIDESRVKLHKDFAASFENG